MLRKYLCFKNITRILFVILILVILVETQAQINPYKILGLQRNANEKQIRNAYRKLAKGKSRVYHAKKKTYSNLLTFN